ncbi:DUF6985 domain-containing protein [Hymenobacter canadensis]|uniref:DUF6985 domain-containing protein n=1 Tax=Hymenobacter canadensis TaxID=2999067 RepID=A0ABY7LLU7_9BACT|nr:hypothetical protein [Hymenobacter canadensis]WBA40769.1 hypothetical protein O3303_13170 [Hymenobacter canadensis]
MNNWKQTVRFDETEGLMADVPLDFVPSKPLVRLMFDLSGQVQTLTPEMAAAAEAVLQQLPGLNQSVAEAAFEHFQMMRQMCGDIYNEEDELLTAADATELQALYQLQTIYFPEEPEIGRFGLSFVCQWEIEHGFGLQFRNWNIVEVGGEAEAFSFYD